MERTALICGISGQDGAYLARLLLNKGYRVYGSSRDARISSFHNLERLGVHDKVKTISVSLVDFWSVRQALINVQPDEVYNLAGQSSIGLSFEQPVETLESIALGTLNLLESIRFTDKPIRLYNACSTEIFGDTTNGEPATELSPFRPRSPYAVAKAAAFWELANYRETYRLHACSGLLSNHESPLRDERFVTRKIILSATRIAKGAKEKLCLGNLAVYRDWGWAPEYVETMWLMLQQPQAIDFIVSTGECHSLEEFVATTFEFLGLDWHEHVLIDKTLFRPTENLFVRASAMKAKTELGWEARHKMKQVIRLMLEAEQLSTQRISI